MTRRDITKTFCSNLPDAHPKEPRRAWKTIRNVRPKTETRPITARTATTMVSNFFSFSLTILASLNNCTVHIYWTTVPSRAQGTVFRPTPYFIPHPVLYPPPRTLSPTPYFIPHPGPEWFETIHYIYWSINQASTVMCTAVMDQSSNSELDWLIDWLNVYGNA